MKRSTRATYGVALALALLAVTAVNGSANEERQRRRTPPGGLAALESELSRSPAGRNLLAALRRSRPGGDRAGLELLVSGLEREVCDLTGLLVDASDPHLLEAATALHRVPRSLRRESIAAVMVLIDEWAARLPDGHRRRPWERVVERMRGQRVPSNPADRRLWLARRFPLIESPAVTAWLKTGLTS